MQTPETLLFREFPAKFNCKTVEQRYMNTNARAIDEKSSSFTVPLGQGGSLKLWHELDEASHATAYEAEQGC